MKSISRIRTTTQGYFLTSFQESSVSSNSFSRKVLKFRGMHGNKFLTGNLHPDAAISGQGHNYGIVGTKTVHVVNRAFKN